MVLPEWEDSEVMLKLLEFYSKNKIEDLAGIDFCSKLLEACNPIFDLRGYCTVLRRRAIVCIIHNRLQEACEDIHRLLDVNVEPEIHHQIPDINVQALFLNAAADARDNENYKQAINFYRCAATTTNGRKPLQIVLGELHCYLELKENNIEFIVFIILSELRANPGFLADANEYFLARGDQELQNKNYNRALRCYNHMENVIDNCSRFANLPLTYLEVIKCKKAMVHIFEGHERKAEKELCKVKKGSNVEITKMYDALHSSANDLFHKEKYQDSILAYKGCILLAKKISITAESLRDLHVSLVILSMKENCYEKAVKWMQSAREACNQESEKIALEFKEFGNQIFRSSLENNFELARDAYTLAIDLAPKGEVQLRSFLFSNSSLMSFKMKNFQSAERSAKMCIKASRGWAKGYYRLGKAHLALEKYDDAQKQFREGLKYAESTNDRDDIVVAFVQAVGKVEGKTLKWPDSITSTEINNTFKALCKDWDNLSCTGLKWIINSARGNELIDIDIQDLEKVILEDKEGSVLENVVKKEPKLKHRISSNLFKIALENGNFKAVLLFIKHGLPKPEFLNVSPEDPHLHQATQIALNGYTGLLPEALKEFSSSETDLNGCTVLHFLASGAFSNPKLACLKIVLESKNIELNKKNSNGKTPLELLNKDDRRYKHIQRFVNNYLQEDRVEMDSNKKNKKKRRKNKREEAIKKMPAFVCSSNVTAHHDRKISMAKSPADRTLRAKMNSEYDTLKNKVSQLILNIDFDNIHAKSLQIKLDNTQVALNKEDIIPEKFTDILTPQSCPHQSTSNANEWIQMLVDSFDKEQWEIECTSQVIKVMKELCPYYRSKLLERLSELVKGSRDCDTTPVEMTHTSRAPILFKTRVVDGLTLLWEEALAFSTRHSIVEYAKPEIMLRSVYRSIIRIWYVIFYDDTLPEMKKRIHKAYERGSTCFAPKLLKEMCVSGEFDEIQGPSLYEDSAGRKRVLRSFAQDIDTPEHSTSFFEEPGTKIFYPPASPNEKEFHILKFYSCTSSLAETLLKGNEEYTFDCPFKVSDLEFSVVNLKSMNKCPTLLLGRSGTGKTTCCIYLLWKQYRDYWTKAVDIGPYIPKVKLEPNVDATAGEMTFEEDNFDATISVEEKPATVEPEEKAFYGLDVEEKAPTPSLYNFFSQCRCTGACGCYFEDPAQRKKEYFSKKVLDLSTLGPVEGQVIPEVNSFLEDNLKANTVESTENVSAETENLVSAESPQHYEHLRQLFLTKNYVLCNEVSKTFNDFLHGFPAAESMYASRTNEPATSLSAISYEEYPLFLNSHQWLLLLDATLDGTSFFPRDEERKLLYQIPGWNDISRIKSYLHQLDLGHLTDDSDSNQDQSDDSESEIKCDYRDSKKIIEVSKMRQVTYDIFVHEYWHKITKKLKCSYHPSLVWTEICSFIKGSYDALDTRKGFLSLKEYKALGKKLAPNFNEERDEIYNIFIKYQERKIRERMFDEADVCFNIYNRLIKQRTEDWAPHEIYVDETQDFSQAELLLLILCCRNPNAVFLTGDTAQSITRGISFRFKDVKTLFYVAGKISKEIRPSVNVTAPSGVYKLLHNYRSHDGILNLAASIIDLLKYYFSNSFDHLTRDISMFPGPKPILLETKEPGELAVILQGSKRETTTIEFGAHQVVLVADEDAKKRIPAELNCALVLTILEAKGLEFDDVLLYNFFSSSQASSEWRLVRTFLDHLIDTKVVDPDKEDDNPLPLCGITYEEEDEMKFDTRPLDFDEKKHKILNSELKQLYTALTRARVNVWIFDENESKRGPIFEYFMKRRLVELIKIENDDDGRFSSKIFAKKSSPEDWHNQGKYFFDKKIWGVAATCFKRAGSENMVKRCVALQQENKAYELAGKGKAKFSEVCTEYLRAASLFLDIQLLKDAQLCLKNIREWSMLACLHERMGENKDAGKCYLRGKEFEKASKCFRADKDYRNAIDVLYKEKFLDKAAALLFEYETLSSTGNISGVRQPRSTLELKRVCFEAADLHYEKREFKEMTQILRSFLTVDNQLEYLGTKKQLLGQKIELLKESGRFKEAVRLLLSDNRFIEIAAIYNSDGQQEKKAEALLTNCKMIICKSKFFYGRDGKIYDNNPELEELILPLLEETRICCSRAGTSNLALLAHLSMLSAIILNSNEECKRALLMFTKQENVIGIYAAQAYRPLNPLQPDRRFIKDIKNVLDAVYLFSSTELKKSDEEKVQEWQTFLGWEQVFTGNEKRLYLKDPWQYSFISLLLGKRSPFTEATYFSVTEGRSLVAFAFLTSVVTTFQSMRKILNDETVSSTICPLVLNGCICHPECEYLHEHPSQKIFNRQMSLLLKRIAIDSVSRDFSQRFSHVPLTLEGVQKIATKARELVPRDMGKPLKRLFYLFQTYSSFLGTNGFEEINLNDLNSKEANMERSQIIWHLQTVRKEHLKVDGAPAFISFNTFIEMIFYSVVIGESPSFCDIILDDQLKYLQEMFCNQPIPNNVPGFIDNKSEKETLLVDYFISSKKALHLKCDCPESLFWSSTRFLSMTVSEKKTLELPAIDLFLNLVEYNYTLCCFMLVKVMKNQNLESSVLLPYSYIKSFNFWDNHYRKLFDQTSVSALQALSKMGNTYAAEKSSVSAVRRITEFVTGSFSEKMHLISIISIDRNCIFFRRVLVLSLLLLINSVPFNIEKKMVINLVEQLQHPELQKCEEQSVCKVLTDFRSGNPMDVIPILVRYMKDTGNDLLEVKWNASENQPEYKPFRGEIEYKNIKNFQYEMEKKILKKTDDNTEHDSYGDYFDDTVEQEEDHASGLKEKEISLECYSKAATKIQALVRRHLKAKKQRSPQNFTENGLVFKPDQHVNDKQCNICGIDFANAKEDTLAVDIDPVVHVNGKQHQENKNNYENFSMFVETVVRPVLNEAENKIDSYDKLFEDDPKSLSYDRTNCGIQALRGTWKGLEEKKLWNKQDLMQNAVNKLNDASYKLQSEIETHLSDAREEDDVVPVNFGNRGNKRRHEKRPRLDRHGKQDGKSVPSRLKRGELGPRMARK